MASKRRVKSAGSTQDIDDAIASTRCSSSNEPQATIASSIIVGPSPSRTYAASLCQPDAASTVSSSPHARTTTPAQGAGEVNCSTSTPDLTSDLAYRLEQALGGFTERLHGLEKRYEDDNRRREQTLADLAEKEKIRPPGVELGTGDSERLADLTR